MNRNFTWYSIIIIIMILYYFRSQIEQLDMKPPIANKHPHKTFIHGQERVDNYHWIRLSDEQKSAKNSEGWPDDQTMRVVNYINKENDYTSNKLKHTEKLQKKLYSEIVGRIKKDDSSVPYFDNGYWYYTRYEKGQEYPIYCRKKESLENMEELLIDVNQWAEGHDYFSLRSLSVSPNNKLLAFSVDTLSRRIYTIKVKNLETGELLGDEINGTEGPVAWANDNLTFFYTLKNKTTLLSENIARHKLGTPQSTDAIVFKENDDSFYIGVYRSKSDKYIIIYNSSTLVSDYHILNADSPRGKFQQFTPREKEHEYSIEHFKDKFYIVTNWNAMNFRLMETSENSTEKQHWKEVISHREDVFLNDIDVFSNYLVISERKDGLPQIRIINQNNGKEHYLDFGEEVYSAYTSINLSFDTNLLRYQFSSLITPPSTYDYNMDSRKSKLLKQSEVVGGYDPDKYQSERIYVTVRDGKRVPISIVYKKGMKRNGKNNLLLYAYGSYGSTMDPSFNSNRLSLLDRGFAYAIAHIRGSQTYGRGWYEDGKMFNKINTFNDFIDCSKFLIQNKYTDPNHLFAMGGSAGGLLMGAVVNMAPDLYHGVVAAVPFVDVINTMMDPSIPLTSNEWDEWGDPRKKDEYDYIMKYSPYDNVYKVEYPNMLVTAGYFDSQVQYWEPVKWVAKLREYKSGNNELYLYTNMDAGHGGKSGRFRRYKELALNYAFLIDLAGIKY
ncbi:MAG: S9 family peptidase [Candidatus Neomarinimicrobiota bacterium]|nr:S9 family peptidase [Candidatus Neomarinimicrobiota bacterium]